MPSVDRRSSSFPPSRTRGETRISRQKEQRRDKEDAGPGERGFDGAVPVQCEDEGRGA